MANTQRMTLKEIAEGTGASVPRALNDRTDTSPQRVPAGYHSAHQLLADEW